MIIGFCNEKGGVAKTTLSLHTATWLARRGRRVVLMDLDTQGGVSNFLGVKPAEDVAELLRSVLFLRTDRRPPVTSFLFPCPGYSNLALLRGYSATGEVEADLRQPGRPRPGAVLAEALGPLTSKGVIVVVDTGSKDDTPELLRAGGAEVIEFAPLGGLIHAAKNRAMAAVDAARRTA